VVLQLDVEQKPRRSHGVTLLGRLDRLGRQEVEIRWEWDIGDRRSLMDVRDSILRKWSMLGPGWPAPTPSDPEDIGGKLHDTFHPVGTCRMGSDEDAVVDLACKVCGLDNLYVAGTAVLPSAGCANPTLTALCLAERLVEDLSEQFAKE